ncbi:MAG TPA: GntR family transcriptional regulator [Candidatus Limiplasma sp.]|nr:GntR family transcriptional regulator [Candidatus Limiplasma sp.]HPS80280.1 GntR family transcriptional regulator [Candidatus Limiplasma sp.]
MTITERYARETARDYAMRMLKRNIASLELIPGSMLSENELSSELGLSRTPIREALIELSKIKIVEILPQRGSRIALIDCALVEESRFLRLVLEKAIVELACQLAPTLDFSVAEANVKLQQFYMDNQLIEKLLDLDKDFHREFFRLTQRLQTYQLLDSMSLHFDRVRSLSITIVKENKIVSDHEALLAAVRAGDQAEAVAQVAKHLNRYTVDAQAIRERYSRYFTPKECPTVKAP